MNLNQPPDQIVKVEVARLAADGPVADSVGAVADSVAGLAGVGMGEGEGMAVAVAPPAEVRLKLSTKVPRCFG